MNQIERFKAVMGFKPVDRLPLFEFAGWWDKTQERWYQEGLPARLTDAGEIREYLGLDRHHQFRIIPRGGWPRQTPQERQKGIVKNIDEYRLMRDAIYKDVCLDKPLLEGLAEKQKAGEVVLWLDLDGFFWYPREVLGVESHLLAFYDNQELMHLINSDLLAYNLRILEEFCRICVPDFIVFTEDMAYNKGPMLSKACFDRFLAPCYRRIIPELKQRGIVSIVDSDGQISPMISWLEEVGVEGVLPLEKVSGVDIVQIRRDHPKLRMIGGFDKTVMHLGEEAMRQEFERIFPVMKQGGFIPSVDHQTPPDVSLEQYRCYVNLLKEYCKKAAELS
jgi:hypothetical protein